MQKNKLLLLTALLSVIVLFFLFDLDRYLTLEYIRSGKEAASEYYGANPYGAAGLYFLLYVAVTGLSLPGAAILSLAGGAVFGLLWGTVLVSFASTLGATIAFACARFILRDYVQNRFSGWLKAINRGVERDGAYYLFTLRMVPLFPFFAINLAMALTPIRLLTFIIVSQIGMLPATIVFVNAGDQLAQITTPADIVSPGLLAAFALLGIFPLLAKKFITITSGYRVYRHHSRPRRFDRNLIIIGGGAAGLAAAYLAAALKARVTLVEKGKMGGECLNTGCVPSKALIRSARFLSNIRRAEAFGIKSADTSFDFACIMERVQRVIRTVEPHDSVNRYTALGVECLQGEARIRTPWTVEINGRELSTRNIIIAAGAEPFIPPIKGLDQVDYFTSETIWGLRVLPERLVVLGGGPAGCELAQCFARFGSRVTQIEVLPRLLPREDPEISRIVAKKFEAEGIEVLTRCKAVEIVSRDGANYLACESEGKNIQVRYDGLLIAAGRRANTSDYGLGELHVPLTPQGTIEVNDCLQTVYPNIFACGDVAGPYQYTHAASHQARYAVVNALFGGFRKFRVDYSAVPHATFTDPEIARVGLNEQEAAERGVAYEITTYDMGELDRAITDEAAHGLVKILTVPGRDRILGATIVGERAGDLITEFISAMKNNIGLNRILDTIHVYPTFAEANRYAAGNWKKAHTPAMLLNLMGKYHAWRRG